MKDIIIDLLGEYTPNLGPNGEVLGGLYSLDLSWVVGAVAFIVLLLGMLSLLRILLKGLLGG